MMDFTLSSHALERSAQRNISDDDIDFILTHGVKLHRTGVIFCQLRHKNLPEDLPGNHRARQLVGTTLVLCKCGQYIVTVYREERAFHRDKRKAKYCATPGYGGCPGCCAAA